MAENTRLTLTLVRTGLTSWEQAGRLAGGVDIPLCTEASAACGDLARQAASSEPDLILHADDQASRATADAIDGLARDAKVREVEELAEINLGLWAGVKAETLEDRSPQVWRLWRDDPTGVNVPEGEQVAAAADRIVGTLVKALGKAKGGSSVVVVLRPIAFGMVRCWLDALPLKGLWKATEGVAPIDRREISKDHLKRDPAGA
ncbi:MAG: histidine phosphatase family protein [Phycisphaerales bacterium]|nr:histidine phosphatase family protein [Phycisphaerales bacterium]MCB9841550.1 histidine phosphatase family protein [Phycisphaeraceae bacterium]